jgi:hypothetical protein
MPPKVPRVPGEKNPSPTLGEYKANVKRILRQVVGSIGSTGALWEFGVYEIGRAYLS